MSCQSCGTVPGRPASTRAGSKRFIYSQNCGPIPGRPALTRAASKRFIYSDDDAPSPDSSASTDGSSTCSTSSAAASAPGAACDGGPSSPASSSPASSLLTSLVRQISKRFIYSDSPDSSARTGSSSTCSAVATASGTAFDGGPSSPASSFPTSSLLTSSTRQLSIFTCSTVSSRDCGEDHLEEIEALPAFTRDLLVRASCIGSYFDDYVIKQVLHLPCIDDEVARTPSFRRRGCFARAIADAEKRGIVRRVGRLGYQFRSTSLLEAFYDRLPRESREGIHLEIGRVMKKGLRRRVTRGRRPTLGLNYKMFQCSPRDMTSFVQRYFKSAADQLEQGKGLVSTQEELEEISSLNDRATELSGGKRRVRKIVIHANTF